MLMEAILMRQGWCVLSCFLKVWMVEQDVTGIPDCWTDRSETPQAEYGTDMWDTKSMSTRRAEDARRNTGVEWGMTDMMELWCGVTWKWVEQFWSECELKLEASGDVSTEGQSWTEIWSTWQHEQAYFEFFVREIDSWQRCWTDMNLHSPTWKSWRWDWLCLHSELAEFSGRHECDRNRI